MRYLTTVAFEDRTMDDYWRFRQGYAGEPITGLIVQVGGAADDGMRIISRRPTDPPTPRFRTRT